MKNLPVLTSISLFCFVNSMVAAEDSKDDLLREAQAAIQSGKSEQAVGLLDRVLKLR